ncbi:hypothetical protein [Aureispira anguillae]|uniref:Uncharacterized protein n=1 Tax=Aureispira anguillae TaxID=2864201 RepID=A0A915YEC8_9BACT|nr:hypothetical protein [Aureispira anguillae]BDS11463.1 hypothetical protein AsAng_0021770 [Aureispira anguillae]
MKLLMLIVLFALPSGLSATMQIPDTVIYKTKKYTLILKGSALHYSPLCFYYLQNDISMPFNAWSSAVKRRHIATWQIIDNKLFLTKVNTVEGPKPLKDCQVQSISSSFNTPNLLFADWFSGIFAFGFHCFHVKEGKIILDKKMCDNNNYLFFSRCIMKFDSIYSNNQLYRLTTGYYKKSPIFDYFGQGSSFLDWPYNWENKNLCGVPLCKWKITNDSLFLDVLNLYTSEGKWINFLQVGAIKNITNHSFADWVNGVYRIEKGKMVKEIVYDDVEWEFFKVSEYQYIRIKKGVIVESFVVEPNFDIKNPPPNTDPKGLQIIADY